MMQNYNRILNLQDLVKKKSIFLFGPRSTGKSSLLEKSFPKNRIYDLLDDSIFQKLLRNPKIIEEENPNPAHLIIIDEIQKLPKLLDEVHRLIKKNYKFLLTGSSARKLKRGGANLLGGRAWEARLFPLVSKEITDFNLLKYLNRGGLPHLYQSLDYEEDIESYTNLYLREEIIAEGAVKNHEYFLSFLDAMSLSNGQELNFEGIASDSGVPPRTVQNYVQILEDTLMGYQLKPFLKTQTRKAIRRSKFFLFDIGVCNYLAKRGEIKQGNRDFGFAFEHFIINEVQAYQSYYRKKMPLCYWRSTSQIEVDLIIGNKMAIEIKSTRQVSDGHCKGLIALKEEGLIERFLFVSQDSEKRKMKSNIEVYPYQVFLNELWGGKLF